MSLPTIIAIDGPAASGKSTVARRLAEELGYLFFDTGVMYRAVTLAALDAEADMEDDARITSLAEKIHIDVRLPSKENGGRGYEVWVDGRDVTLAIRQPAVDANVSVVSAYAGVRDALTPKQRQVGMRGKVIMVGRDIGTVVLPEADLKIYLDASAEERARRRYDEGQARGEEASYEEILEAMRYRDRFDSTRAIAPLRPAEDAHTLDTDGLSIAEVIEKVRELVNESK